ncbi:NAD(P)/FAD-dependent oxidoreductase [Rugamonas sp. CCM 8940]|uniref:NAD(P)/FAD-dependent oxidoreductase n=1 Tax=Rugamonas sp. CCM 8940 TaxID=2765359 RepID=UPI0018F5BFA1|nr:NAD(P)/FAD-dependent oxidoreductase [Rugamonas sp. CCM 8940]MBJ7310379.1 NAD(P)/FAD-dependent oxidoreductase [Rugamonas sp. CCM 8940]
MSYDVIVVGGSFAGLSAAMQLARARRRVLLIDAGQPRNRFAAHSHGFLGQDGKAPHEIVAEARRQLAAYPTVAFADGLASAARQTAHGFAVMLGGGREETGARLVLATGMRDELPAIAGIEGRWGTTVLHCPYCHGYEVSGQPLGVLANHALSVHQGMLLPDWGSSTTYFTQGVFEPDAQQLIALEQRGVQIERTPVVGFAGTAPAMQAVRLADGRVLTMAAVFTAPRSRMASPLAQQLACAFDDGPLGATVRVDEMQQTSVKGVYAAGDMAQPRSNATLASAGGVMAGVGAHQSLIFG